MLFNPVVNSHQASATFDGCALPFLVVRTTHTLSVPPNSPVNLFVSFFLLCWLVTSSPLLISSPQTSSLWRAPWLSPWASSFCTNSDDLFHPQISKYHQCGDLQLQILSTDHTALLNSRFIYPLGHRKDKTELLLFPQNMFYLSSPSQFILTPLLHLPRPNIGIIFDLSFTQPPFQLVKGKLGSISLKCGIS